MQVVALRLSGKKTTSSDCKDISPSQPQSSFHKFVLKEKRSWSGVSANEAFSCGSNRKEIARAQQERTAYALHLLTAGQTSRVQMLESSKMLAINHKQSDCSLEGTAGCPWTERLAVQIQRHLSLLLCPLIRQSTMERALMWVGLGGCFLHRAAVAYIPSVNEYCYKMFDANYAVCTE